MNLRKIAFVGLTSCAIMLTACGRKESSYSDVCKHITDNYTGESEKLPTQHILEFQGSAGNDASKNEVIQIANYWGFNVDANLHSRREEAIKGKNPICTIKVIPTEGAKYYIENRELTYEIIAKTEAPQVTVTDNFSLTYNKEGYESKASYKTSLKTPTLDYTITFSSCFAY